MTREEAIEFGKMWLQVNEDCKDSSTYIFFQMAIKALEQEPILDKIRAEVEQKLTKGPWNDYRNRERDGAFLEVLEILDKYKAEQEKKMNKLTDGIDSKAKILKELELEKLKSKSNEETIQPAWEDIDKQEIAKSVVILDLFAKTFCRYVGDYERFGDLKFRCKECPFEQDDGKCLTKQFKNKYAPDYRDFGCMGDL